MDSDVDLDFDALRHGQISAMQSDADLQQLTRDWFLRATDHGYSYHFDVLGRPVIQFPQDLVALNEIIWRVRPDVVIETGIARGGSVINTASQLALLDLSEIPIPGLLEPRRKVLAVDIDIRSANREALERHFLAPWFELLEGSSTSPEVVEVVRSRIPEGAVVLVLLDSNHTHSHVLAELEAYAPLVTPASYCIVYDTVIEHMPSGYYQDRPWDVGDSPATAVAVFLKSRADFVIDESISDKLLISVAPGGYLLRTD
jgi:cephalosporin hydroxylase